MNKNRQNRGITLIALIITVIILLILVAVGVNIAINGDLIGIAEETANKTNNKVGHLQNRVDELGGDVLDSYEWANGQEKEANIEHDWQYVNAGTRVEVKCICEECKKTDPAGRIVQIGQEVEYSATVAYTTETEKYAKTVAYSEAEAYAKTVANAGAGSEKWVVLGIEDKNENGTNEGLLITTLEPITATVTIPQADKYNYSKAIDLMHAKCKELYGENARAMTIEDVNNVLGMNITGGMYLDVDGWFQRGPDTSPDELSYAWYILDGFDETLDSLDMWEAIQEQSIFYTPEYPEGTTDATKLGKIKVDGYIYARYEGDYIGSPKIPDDTSEIPKNLIFGEESSYEYSLACQGTYAEYCNLTPVIYFGIGCVWDGWAWSGGNTDRDFRQHNRY